MENEERDGDGGVRVCEGFVGGGEEVMECDEVGEGFRDFVWVDGYDVVMDGVMEDVMGL